MHPTHLLEIYDDQFDYTVLFRIKQNMPPDWLEKPKSRGDSFSHNFEKKIKASDIIVLDSDSTPNFYNH